MKRILSLVVITSILLSFFISDGTKASYDNDINIVKVGQTASTGSLCEWNWNELRGGSYSGDMSVSSWYTNTPQNAEQVGLVLDGSKLVYDSQSNEGIADKVNPIYKTAFGKTANTFLISNADGKIYTWRVNIASLKETEGKYGCQWGNGVEFYLYNTTLYDRLAFKINYRGGILDGAGNLLKENGYLSTQNEYMLDFVVDNTGSNTKVSMYTDGEYIGTYEYAMKYTRITNFRSYILPTSNNVWVPVRIEYGAMKLYEGDFAGVYEDESIDAKNNRIVVEGAANTEYEIKVLKPKSDTVGIDMFSEAYDFAEYESASEEEKADMLFGKYQVVTDENGEGSVKPDIQISGRYRAYLEGGNSSVEFFADAESLIASCGEYPKNGNFVLALGVCSGISESVANEITDILEGSSDIRPIIELSENDYKKLVCATWWSFVCNKDSVSFDDINRLGEYFENAGYDFGKNSELLALTEDATEIILCTKSGNTLAEINENIAESCILTGVENAKNGFEAVKFIENAGNEYFNNLELYHKVIVAGEVCGIEYESLAVLNSAIEGIKTDSYIKDENPNFFVTADTGSAWERVWDFENPKANDSLGAGYYNSATVDTSAYPVNKVEDGELVYSAGDFAGMEFADSAYYVFNNNNRDETELVSSEQAANGKFTISFDMTLNGGYGEGFRVILRYNAVAGSARELVAFMVNYKGAVVNQKNEWIKGEGFIKSGQTYHYSIVVDVENTLMDIYVDGVKIGSSPYYSGGSDKQDSLYAVSIWYYPRVYGKWTDTQYRFGNLRIESGVHVDGKEAKIYAEDGKIIINSAPGSEFTVRLYKPDRVIPFMDSYVSSYTPEDYDYCIQNGFVTSLVATDDIEVVCDEDGYGECEPEMCDGGRYFVVAKLKDGSDVYELAVYNKPELLLEVDAEYNIRTEEFKDLYQVITDAGEERCNEIYEYANATDDAGAVIRLADGDFDKLYVSLLWQKMIESESADADILKKLISELDFLEYDSSCVELLMHNRIYADVVNMIGDSADFESACKALKEAAILCGVKNVTFNSESAVFLTALSNSKYEKASKSEKTQIHNAVSKKSFKSVDELEDAISDVEYKKEDSGKSGGGGSGTSKNTPGITPVVLGEEPSVTPNVSFEESGFSDVLPSHWAYMYITELCEKGVVSGYNGEFMPDNNITRAQFIKILCGVFEIESSDEAVFNDVKSSDWFFGYVNGASKAGIVQGDGINFNPDAQITREDAVSMLFRIINDNTSNISDNDIFLDWNEISPYAREAVAMLSESGIISGYEDLTFRPKNSLTRAEASKMVYGFVN